MDFQEFQKGSIWAISSNVFDTMQATFHKFKASDLAAASQNFSEGTNTKGNYKVVDGSAVIEIRGPISKNPSIFSYLFGGISITEIGEMLQSAVTDPKITTIILNVDSPGGTISGLNELSDEIYKARKQKPIITFSSGTISSGAYWIGSAADRIVLGETTDAGAIGVMMIHSDYSEMDKKNGVKITYITAGKYKALGNPSEPLNDEAKNEIQKRLDYVYGVFVDDVARNRGVSAKIVRKNMADGRNFIGKQAVDAGIADTIGTLNDAISLGLSMAQAKNKKPANVTVKVPSVNAPKIPAAIPISVKALSVKDQAKHDYAKSPELQKEFRTESAYVAFKKAEASGKVKFHGPKFRA